MDTHRDLPDEAAPTSDVEAVAKGRDLVVVIGIDKYQDKGWHKLGNAVMDALGVQQLFTQTLNFSVAVEPLLNDQATKPAITALVQEQLHELLKPDDNLVLFFAGHGCTRVTGPQGMEVETGYIIPVEARAGHWGDYIKINSFLEDASQLPAHHILVILDSCYAGFALGEAMQVHRGGEVRYQHDLVKRRSRKAITSARRDQRAMDGGPRPGHSLFTGTLIDGLYWGEADLDGNKFVTSSELGLFLEQRVGQSSKSEQTPDFGSFYLDDRGEMVIPLGAPDRLTMRQHYELGCHLFELGRLLDDKGRLRSAVRHLEEAIRLSHINREDFAQAHLQLGRVFMALGELGKACKALQEALAQDDGLAEASFYLGIVLAKQGDDQTAARAFETFLAQRPSDENAACVAKYVDLLNKRPAGRRHALLIGVSQHADPRVAQLRGPSTDIQLMKAVLLEKHGFQEADILTLLDEQATYESIIRAFHGLWDTNPGDIVVVFFSGHGLNGSGQEQYLVPYDATWGNDGARHDVQNTISAIELHDLVDGIPAMEKLLVLDTHANKRFLELARSGTGYAVIVATQPGEPAHEVPADLAKPGDTVGLLTLNLVAQLRTGGPVRTTYGQLIDGVKSKIAGARNYEGRQTPLFVGNPDWPLFGVGGPELGLFEFAERRNYAALSASDVERLYTRYNEQIHMLPPQAHYSFGRAFLEKRNYPEAIRALQRAVEERRGAYFLANIVQAVALLHAGSDDEARLSFRQAAMQGEADQHEVALILGKLLLLLGDPETATAVLQRITSGDRTEAADEAWYYLGLALAAAQQPEGAAEALAAFLERCAENGQTTTIRRRAVRLSGGTRKHALLIGVGKYAELPSLQGPPQDVQRLKEVLLARYGFEEESVIDLIDERATRQRILDAFERLIVDVVPGDVVLVFFSGHETESIVRDVEGLNTEFASFFMAYDTSIKGWRNAITGREFCDLLARIPTEHKTVVLDPGSNELFHWAAEQREYAFFVSASPGQGVYEGVYEIDGVSFAGGLFAHHFIQRLWSAGPEGISAGEMLDAVTADIQGKRGSRSKGSLAGWSQGDSQKPQFVGEWGAVLFAGAVDPGAALLDVRRANSILKQEAHDKSCLDRADELLRFFDHAPVQQAVELLGQLTRARGRIDPESTLDLGIACALLGDYELSIAALKQAIDERGEQLCPDVHYHLGRILFESGRDLESVIGQLRLALRCNQHDARIHYYLGKALHALAELDILAQAKEAFAAYLDGGAPLGGRDKIEQFLRSREAEEPLLTR